MCAVHSSKHDNTVMVQSLYSYRMVANAPNLRSILYTCIKCDVLCADEVDKFCSLMSVKFEKLRGKKFGWIECFQVIWFPCAYIIFFLFRTTFDLSKIFYSSLPVIIILNEASLDATTPLMSSAHSHLQTSICRLNIFFGKKWCTKTWIDICCTIF